MRLFAILFLSLYALSSQALDKTELQAPPLAQLTSTNTELVHNYRLVLSELKRQHAQTFGEQEQRTKGKLWRRSWRTNEYDLNEINQFFLQQLSNAQLLYKCQNLDCGTSQFWANEIFANPALLGRDNQQRYFVAQQSGKVNLIYVFYAAKRHTGAYSFNLDILTSQQPLASQAVTGTHITQQLKANSGWLSGLHTYPDGRLDADKSHSLLTALKQLPEHVKTRLYLLVHVYQHASMQDNLQASDILAKSLIKQTQSAGKALNIQGLGALTPAPNKPSKPQLRFVFWPPH